MRFKKNIKLFFESGLINKSIKVLLLRVFGVLLFFSLTLFLTNYFDSDLVGKYDFSRSLLMFLGAITVLGMQQSIIYYSGYLASKNELYKLKEVYLKMLFILLFTTLLVFIAFYLISNEILNSFFNKNISGLIYKTVFGLFFYGLTVLNIEVFRAINKIFVSEIFRNILRFLFFLIVVVVLFFTHNENYLINVFILNFVVLGMISTIVLGFNFNRQEQLSTTSIKISYKDIIKRSSPMAISSIAFILMQSIDLILIGKFTNFKMVAYYAVTVKLTMIISLVLTSVNAVLAPKIAELHSLENYKSLNEIIKKATRLIFILTMPGILILVLFSSFILGLFGEEYIIAKNTLLILLIGQSINALCGSVGVYMNMTGKQNILQILLIFSLLINLVLNWVLIPKYGIIGAAIATSFSMVLWNIAGSIYLFKKDNIKTFLN